MLRRAPDLFPCILMLICMTLPITLIMRSVDNRKQLSSKLSLPEMWFTKPDFNNTSCYNETVEDDVLEDVLEKIVLANSVFFHETSCCRNPDLPLRLACAIESASRTLPDRQIVVLFTKSLTDRDFSSGPLKEVLKLINVDFARVNLSNYALGTPLEKVFERNLTSKRVAEYLKFLTLYRYGGTVVDLDMLVTPKMFSGLPYWVSKKESKKLGTAVISLTTDKLGRKLSRQFLSALEEQAKLDELDGGQAMYEVLKRQCNTSDLRQMTYSKCGVHVHGNDVRITANRSTWQDSLKPIQNLQGVSTYSGYLIENNDPLPTDSLYAEIALGYCPILYNNFISELILEKLGFVDRQEIRRLGYLSLGF